MNFILMTLLISFGLYAVSSAPESGMYSCIKGNDESICDQSVKMLILSSGKINGVKVYYEGYCNGQGPYIYGCNEQYCGDGIIKISFVNQTHYRWENRNYNRFCVMKKVGH